ncbi:MAG: RNA polymerase sigma factor [Coprobacillaceae bacterium]
MGKSYMVPENIIIRAQGGDKEAFTIIYKSYYNKVFFTAMHFFNDKEVAHDVVQEVFIRVYRKVNSLNEPKAFHSWIQRITYNECLNRTRKKTNIIDLGDDMDIDDFSDEETLDPSDALEQQRMKEVVITSLETMSIPLKSVGLLRFNEELKIDEIADILDIPKGTVNSRINKIKRILKTDLESQGISPLHYSAGIISPMMLKEAYTILSSSDKY